jgi:NADH:ubiquinone oxidoreductase subunit 4 (subunit M)
MLVGIVVLGIFPNLIFGVTDEAVQQTMVAFRGLGG